MNWIDKKYKEILGNREFPKGMKEEGWQKAQKLLDEEFPLGTPKAGSGPATTLWKYGIGVALVVVGLTAGLVLFNENNSSEESSVSYYAPRTGINKSPVSSEERAGMSVEDFSGSFPGEQVSEIPSSANSRIADLEVKNQDLNEGHIPESAEETSEGDFFGEQNGTDNIARGGTEARESEGEVPTSKEQDELIEKMPGQSELHSSETEVAGSETGNNEGEEQPINDRESQDGSEVNTSANSMENGKIEHIASDNALQSGAPEVETPNLTKTDEESREENESQETISNVDLLTENDSKASVESLTEVEQKSDDLEIVKEDREFPEKPEPNAVSLEDYAEDKEVIPARETEESPISIVKELKSQNWHLAFPEAALTNDEAAPLPSLSNRRFSISLWGGYTYTGKFLQSENPAYLAKRKAEEEPVWTTPTGVNIDYFLSGNWTVGTGVGWSEYGEVLNYNATYTDTTHFDGRYGPPQKLGKILSLDSVRIIDSINRGHWNYTAIHEETDSLIQRNNGRTSITYAEIPLRIGYRFGRGRVKPWVQTGVSIGVPVQSSFRYVDVNGQNLSEDGPSASVAPFQWSYLLNLGIDFKISRHWSLRINSLGSLHLNSVLQNVPPGQKYYRLGGSLGVAYNL